jgi:hypothetical protein
MLRITTTAAAIMAMVGVTTRTMVMTTATAIATSKTLDALDLLVPEPPEFLCASAL